MSKATERFINLQLMHELYTREEMYKLNKNMEFNKNENKKEDKIDFESLGYSSYEEYIEHETFYGNKVRAKKYR